MNQDQQPKRFRRGDPSPKADGLVFMGYTNGGKEWWTTPEKLNEYRTRAKGSSKAQHQKTSRKQWRKDWAKKPETIARIEARKQNPEWLARKRAKNNADQKRRRAENPSFRIAHNIRIRIRSALIVCGAAKAANTEVLIGCSIEAFRLHIEANFKPGMTWDNRTAWHVDHKLPLSMFDLTNPEQQKIAFSFKNCIPEWKTDNLKKNDRIEGELFSGRHYKKIVNLKIA